MAGLIAAWFNVVIGIGIPFAVLLFLLIKKKSYVRWFFLGVLGFLVSQVLTRLPILQIIQGTYGYFAFNSNYPYTTLFLLSLSAGLFEETARYVILFLHRQRGLSSGAAVSYGIGHGGLEASFVGINSLLLPLTDQSNLMHGGWMIALGGLERLSAMMAHIAFSILVYFAVAEGKKIYYLWAIVLHTLYNFLLVFLLWGMSPVIFELLLLILSACLLFTFIHKLRRRKT